MNHKEWKIPYSKPEIPGALLEAGCTPLLAAALGLRGICSASEARAVIECDDSAIHDPMLMQDMDKACRRIEQAVAAREKVAVYGDYDVDGVTSTCLLTDYIRSRGLDCTPYIPDRNDEGYGLNNGAIDFLHSQGISLIITVDCGITADKETDYARSLGIDMVITDHHECKEDVLPKAVAVIDCKRPGNEYPNENLAGVGVALKLVCACEGSSREMLSRYCDLAAIGTVADVMPLIGENRYLVIRGLDKLMHNPRPGIAALLEQSSVDLKKLSSTTIGFSIAPRLNAAGRLGKTAIAAKLLMAEDRASAEIYASELCRLNRERQDIETEIWQDAAKQLEGTEPDAPIVLASEKWHPGVIGIAASRLAEQYSLPAIMINLKGNEGKGSCRSYGGFNLFEALTACQEHLTGFGGHALAAGLNIEAGKIDEFREALADYYREHRPEPQPEVMCDLLISDPSLLSLKNIQSLDRLEPYGNGNPKPLMCFCGVMLENLSTVGGGKHLRMRVRLKDELFECIFFSHTAEELGINEGQLIDLAFTPQINDFRNHLSVQLLVYAARPHKPLELCSGILHNDPDVRWAASAHCPNRGDFVHIWHMMEHCRFKAADDVSGIVSQCPPGMDPERYVICLMVFLEAGLLSPGKSDNIFGSSPAENLGNYKADLEATELMQSLKSI